MNVKAAIIFLGALIASTSANASPIALYCDLSPQNGIGDSFTLSINLEENELYIDQGRVHDEQFDVGPIYIKITDIYSKVYILDRRTLRFTIKKPPENVTLNGDYVQRETNYICSRSVETQI